MASGLPRLALLDAPESELSQAHAVVLRRPLLMLYLSFGCGRWFGSGHFACLSVAW